MAPQPVLMPPPATVPLSRHHMFFGSKLQTCYLAYKYVDVLNELPPTLKAPMFSLQKICISDTLISHILTSLTCVSFFSLFESEFS